ncbi:MAG: hypothetical protein HC887_02335 [Desulfobacteraceae bacterium]|nr:hypothetical protein [Desulfobacteraceae bacterium]
MVIVELGKTYLIAGQALTEKDQRKNPQAISLLDTIFGFGLKSVEFVSGIRKNELQKFLELVGKNPETESPEKLLREASSGNLFPHIPMDHKVYVAVDKDRQILASIGVRDEDIARHFTGDKSMSETELQKVRDMAKNPEWVEKAFQTGMNQLLDRRNAMTINKLAEMIVHIIRVLDDLLEDAGKEKLSAYISSVMADMDDDLLSMILSQNVDELLNGSLFGNLMGKLNDEKFSNVASLIGQSEYAETSSTYQAMMASDKGKRLIPEVQHKISRHKENKQRRIARIERGVAAIIGGETAPFADKEVMEAVPSAVSQMLAGGNISGGRQLADRLADGLLNDSPELQRRSGKYIGKYLRRYAGISQNRGIAGDLSEIV